MNSACSPRILAGVVLLASAAATVGPRPTLAADCLSAACRPQTALLEMAGSDKTFAVAGPAQDNILLHQNTPIRLAGGQVVQSASPSFGFSISRQIWDRQLSISTRYAEDFSRQSVGLSGDAYSLQFVSGAANNHYTTDSTLFAQVAPNLFHGNIEQSYRYRSFGAALQAGNNFDLLAATGFIRSENAVSRSVQAFGFAGDHLSVMLLQAKQGRKTRLSGLALNTQMGDWHFAYQDLRSPAAVRYQRLNTVFSGNSYGDFGLAIEQIQNPLFTAASEQRILLTFSRSFGGTQPAFSVRRRNRGTSHSERSRRNRNLAVVAIAIIPVAALASSGGGGSGAADNSQRFSTQDQVAFNVINAINPTSITENREYGGMVYRNSDGTFGATGPIRGELATVDPGGPSSVPGGTVATGSWHTHGSNDPRFLNEVFSSADLSYSEFYNIDGYLGTPLGKFLLYNVDSNVVTQLGTVAIQ